MLCGVRVVREVMRGSATWWAGAGLGAGRWRDMFKSNSISCSTTTSLRQRKLHGATRHDELPHFSLSTRTMSAPTLPPVHFFSHGSTMMLGEDCPSAAYWKQCGDEALANGIKGVVIMGAHWDCLGNRVQVATNLQPQKSPVSYVDPAKYIDYKLNPDIDNGRRCVELLKAQGFEASEAPTFDWIHDTFLILIRMFPNRCPPTTIVSMNARFDPHYHMKIGAWDTPA